MEAFALGLLLAAALLALGSAGLSSFAVDEFENSGFASASVRA